MYKRYLEQIFPKASAPLFDIMEFGIFYPRKTDSNFVHSEYKHIDHKMYVFMSAFIQINVCYIRHKVFCSWLCVVMLFLSVPCVFCIFPFLKRLAYLRYKKLGYPYCQCLVDLQGEFQIKFQMKHLSFQQADLISEKYLIKKDDLSEKIPARHFQQLSSTVKVQYKII